MVVPRLIAAPSVSVCMLCIVLGGDCVVVSLFIAAPIVCECNILSWALIVLLLYPCLLLLPVCV